MPRLGHFTLGKEICYPWYRRLSGSQGRSGWVHKISPPWGFDPWTTGRRAPIFFIHRKWKQYVPLKLYFPTRLHGVITKEITVSIFAALSI